MSYKCLYILETIQPDNWMIQLWDTLNTVWYLIYNNYINTGLNNFLYVKGVAAVPLNSLLIILASFS